MIDERYVTQTIPTNPIPANPAPTPPVPVIPSGRYHKGAIWGWIIGTLVVLFGAFVAAQWYLSDQVPGGAVVAGVEIGGQSSADAAAALEAKLGALSHQPIPLHAGGAQTTLDPVAAGLTFDAAKTVSQLTRFSLNPARLVTHLQAEYGEVPLIINIDEARFAAAANQAAQALGKAPIDGTVLFTDGQASTTAAQAGQSVSPEAIADAIHYRWLHNEGALQVEAESIVPHITQAATDAAFSLARQIAAGPIQLEVGGQSVSLPANVVTDSTIFRAHGGELVPEFNGELLKHAVLQATDNLLRDPQDAYFEFTNDAAECEAAGINRVPCPVIRGGQTGTELEAETVREAIQNAALSGTRIAQIALIEEEPALSVADLEALGVREVVSSFSTPHDGNVTRTNNLRRASQLITGVLLQPGEIFSLTDAISPINAANGFGEAGVIVGGNIVPAMGGGLSQMATTAFNAGFFAGFEDTESRPHSFFLTRYPAGREATLVLGQLDMRFRNNTPYGALIRSWVSGGSQHVEIWSTEFFRVETNGSWNRVEHNRIIPRTDFVQPTVEERGGPNCVPQRAGQPGFVVTNTRQVFRLDNDEMVINETNRWRYRPQNAIHCVG